MLHVLTGPTCNNNCLFCMEEDRAARQAHVAAQTPRDVRAMLEAHDQRDEVLFTSGEPTLNDDLLAYVKWARQEGYRVIGLITNGRLLSYPGAARRLVAGGVNKITVSIHGHAARLHDGLTRTPGSFEQGLAGLERVVAQRRAARHLTVITSTVINRRNLPHLADIHRLLAARQPELMVFNVIMPLGRGARHISSLVPRHARVAEAFARLAARLEPEALRRVRLVDLPVCVGRDLPGLVWGEPEAFEQYEARGSSGLQGVDPAPCDPQGGAALRGDGDYDVTSRRAKEAALRQHVGPCEDCAARPLCPGVYRAYVEAFGTDELKPISAEALPSLAAHVRPGVGGRRGRRFLVE